MKQERKMRTKKSNRNKETNDNGAKRSYTNFADIQYKN